MALEQGIEEGMVAIRAHVSQSSWLAQSADFGSIEQLIDSSSGENRESRRHLGTIEFSSLPETPPTAEDWWEGMKGTHGFFHKVALKLGLDSETYRRTIRGF